LQDKIENLTMELAKFKSDHFELLS